MNSVKTHLDESRKLVQNITLEKDKLFHECEELKDEMTRHGSDIELNVVKGELQRTKDAFGRLNIYEGIARFEFEGNGKL